MMIHCILIGYSAKVLSAVPMDLPFNEGRSIFITSTAFSIDSLYSFAPARWYGRAFNISKGRCNLMAAAKSNLRSCAPESKEASSLSKKGKIVIIQHKSGLTVKLVESVKSGSILLKAFIIDPVTQKKLSSIPKTCTVHCMEDKEAFTLGLINRTCEQWQKNHRAKTEKAAKSGSLESSIVLKTFNQLDFNKTYFTQCWGAASTRNQASVFFRRNTIPFVERFIDQTCTRADVEDLFQEWLNKASESGNSTKNAARLRQTVNHHLSDAAYIYGAMRAIEPTLPVIDFSGYSTGRSAQPERAKSLPEPVRQRFSAYLEAHVDTDPRETRGAVLMFDAALRTSEAAAQRSQDIKLYDRFALVMVRAQEQDGALCALLKTDAAYRNSMLSFWGKTMVERCNALIDDDADVPPLTAKQLRARIQQALLVCGLDESFMQAARKLMDEEPEFLSDGSKETDVIAYVLRKDRTSRWLNVCGLNCIDVDCLLGHQLDLPKTQIPNFKTLEHPQEVAHLLENYVYNPAVSAHPYYSPIVFGSGESKDLGPAVAYSFRTSGISKRHAKLVITSREVGAVIEVRVPKGQTPKVQIHTLPRRELRDQPVIGAQPIRWIENYYKEEVSGHEQKRN